MSFSRPATTDEGLFEVGQALADLGEMEAVEEGVAHLAEVFSGFAGSASNENVDT